VTAADELAAAAKKLVEELERGRACSVARKNLKAAIAAYEASKT
jgi:hypothetical protein